jgi:hypothetical protein
MQTDKFGIYLDTVRLKVVRINSPHWIPSGKDWVLLTPDVNAALLSIRELVRTKSLVSSPDQVVWGSTAEFLGS